MRTTKARTKKFSLLIALLLAFVAMLGIGFIAMPKTAHAADESASVTQFKAYMAPYAALDEIKPLKDGENPAYTDQLYKDYADPQEKLSYKKEDLWRAYRDAKTMYLSVFSSDEQKAVADTVEYERFTRMDAVFSPEYDMYIEYTQFYAIAYPNNDTTNGGNTNDYANKAVLDAYMERLHALDDTTKEPMLVTITNNYPLVTRGYEQLENYRAHVLNSKGKDDNGLDKKITSLIEYEVTEGGKEVMKSGEAGKGGKVVLGSEASLEKIREEFAKVKPWGDFSEADKKAISTWSTYESAETTIEAYKKEAADVRDLIDEACKDASADKHYTLKSLAEAAATAYAPLAAKQSTNNDVKGLVTNYKNLTDLQAAIKVQEDALTALNAAIENFLEVYPDTQDRKYDFGTENGYVDYFLQAKEQYKKLEKDVIDHEEKVKAGTLKEDPYIKDYAKYLEAAEWYDGKYEAVKALENKIDGLITDMGNPNDKPRAEVQSNAIKYSAELAALEEGQQKQLDTKTTTYNNNTVTYAQVLAQILNEINENYSLVNVLNNAILEFYNGKEGKGFSAYANRAEFQKLKNQYDKLEETKVGLQAYVSNSDKLMDMEKAYKAADDAVAAWKSAVSAFPSNKEATAGYSVNLENWNLAKAVADAWTYLTPYEKDTNEGGNKNFAFTDVQNVVTGKTAVKLEETDQKIAEASETIRNQYDALVKAVEALKTAIKGVETDEAKLVNVVGTAVKDWNDAYGKIATAKDALNKVNQDGIKAPYDNFTKFFELKFDEVPAYDYSKQYEKAVALSYRYIVEGKIYSLYSTGNYDYAKGDHEKQTFTAEQYDAVMGFNANKPYAGETNTEGFSAREVYNYYVVEKGLTDAASVRNYVMLTYAEESVVVARINKIYNDGAIAEADDLTLAQKEFVDVARTAYKALQDASKKADAVKAVYEKLTAAEDQMNKIAQKLYAWMVSVIQAIDSKYQAPKTEDLLDGTQIEEKVKALTETLNAALTAINAAKDNATVAEELAKVAQYIYGLNLEAFGWNGSAYTESYKASATATENLRSLYGSYLDLTKEKLDAEAATPEGKALANGKALYLAIKGLNDKLIGNLNARAEAITEKGIDKLEAKDLAEINDIKAVYGQLSDSQKKLVTNYNDDFTGATDMLAASEAFKAMVEELKNQVNKEGFSPFTPYFVDVAKALYASLDVTHRNLYKASYDELAQIEEDYAAAVEAKSVLSLKGVKAELEEQLKKVNDALDLTKNDSTLAKLKKELEGEIGKLDARIKDLEDWKKTTADALTAAQNDITELQTAHSNFRSEYDQMKADVGTQLDNIKKSITDLEGKITDAYQDAIKQAVADLKGGYEGTLKGLNDALAAAYAAGDTALQATLTKELEDAKTELEGKINTLTEGLDTANGEIDQLQKDLEALKGTVAANKTELQKEIQTKIDEALNALKGTYTKSLSDLESEYKAAIESAKTELTDALTEKYNELNGVISGLQGTVTTNKTDIENKLKAAQEAIQDQIEALETSTSTNLTNEIKKVTDSLNSANTTITEVKAEIDQLRKDMQEKDNDLQGQIDELKGDVKTLKGNVVALTTVLIIVAVITVGLAACVVVLFIKRKS